MHEIFVRWRRGRPGCPGWYGGTAGRAAAGRHCRLSPHRRRSLERRVEHVEVLEAGGRLIEHL